MMEYNMDVTKLVIRNAALVEDAQRVLTQASERLVGAIWDRIGEMAEKQGSFSVDEDRNGDFYLWDRTWPRKEDGAPMARFWLDGQGQGMEEDSWITVLCGLSAGTSAGLYLWCDWDALGMRRKEWKTHLKSFYCANTSLQGAGFCLNERGTALVRFLKFDLDCLANNLEDLDSCLEPLEAAINAIFSERNVLAALVKGA